MQASKPESQNKPRTEEMAADDASASRTTASHHTLLIVAGTCVLLWAAGIAGFVYWLLSVTHPPVP